MLVDEPVLAVPWDHAVTAPYCNRPAVSDRAHPFPRFTARRAPCSRLHHGAVVSYIALHPTHGMLMALIASVIVWGRLSGRGLRRRPGSRARDDMMPAARLFPPSQPTPTFTHLRHVKTAHLPIAVTTTVRAMSLR